ADGGALFLDWYKNLGTQTYYLGEERVREAYIGSTKQPSAKPNAQRGWHFHWRFGRQKGLTGIDNEEQIWGDNAKFAPYTFWLTSNLYTGVVLGAGYKTIDAQIGVFSGNNPLKGYGAYYADADGVSTLSPNTKGNNTPTAAGRITHRGARVYLAISGERNRKGSSWAPALLEGKRYSDLVTLSWRHRLYSKGEINVHGESMGTYYRSGLIETASQAARAASPPEARADEEWGEGLYREFQQRGGYAGVRVAIKRWTLAAFVERFDRLDYNVWCGGVFRASYTIADETTGDTAINCDQNDDLREAVQESRIYWLSYAPNEQLRINTALHHIDNPAPGVSEILPEHGDSRLMIQIALNHQQGF
ncbi:MAG: hypothetical protein K0U36_02020, partial [Alphaproteobacteria bacterium]|nr:hypothetical protein [Alphaproteobacteria bacterium]